MNYGNGIVVFESDVSVDDYLCMVFYFRVVMLYIVKIKVGVIFFGSVIGCSIII